jgi:dihydrofolate synthase/folylpolyglutamate synthase
VTLTEALAWLDARLDHETATPSISAGRIEGLSLEPMFELMALLGDPQHAAPVIHITGTNGKGAVAEMISSLLSAHGLSVGTYTSPHQERLNERIRRDGEPISDEDLAETFAGIAAVEPLLGHRPTWFEAVTAAAFRWFAEAPVDVMVVEVGLLGRYDATNVVSAAVAVITSIGGDHTDFADGWQVEVASEKAGIIGPESIAVLGDIAPELVAVFSAEGPAELVRFGADFDVDSDLVAVGGHVADLRGLHGTYPELFLPVHGAHQVTNAAVAVAAVEAFFGRALPQDVVEEAFGSLQLQGRFEVAHHGPLVVLDGAHNPDALGALGRTLDEEFTPTGSRYVVLGALAGRDIDAVVAAVAQLRPDLVLCTSTEGDRGVAAATLAAAAMRHDLAAEAVADPADAVARALALAAEEDVVVVTGSFRLLAPARAALVP